MRSDQSTAGSYYYEATEILSDGEPLPVDLRMKLADAGYDVDALERAYGF